MKLIRRPLTWIIVLEIGVLIALVVVAVRFVTDLSAGTVSVQLPPAIQAPTTERPTPRPVSRPTPANQRPTPNPASAAQINGDHARLAADQWALVRTVGETARAYLEQVVLPAIESAERRTR